MNRIIHIFAQEFWHTPAYILANREGLVGLRDAIDKCLASAGCTSITALVEFDGEGYDIHVCQCSEDELRRLVSHYTDPVCGSARTGELSPHEIVR